MIGGAVISASVRLRPRAAPLAGPTLRSSTSTATPWGFLQFGDAAMRSCVLFPPYLHIDGATFPAAGINAVGWDAVVSYPPKIRRSPGFVRMNGSPPARRARTIVASESEVGAAGYLQPLIRTVGVAEGVSAGHRAHVPSFPSYDDPRFRLGRRCRRRMCQRGRPVRTGLHKALPSVHQLRASRPGGAIGE